MKRYIRASEVSEDTLNAAKNLCADLKSMVDAGAVAETLIQYAGAVIINTHTISSDFNNNKYLAITWGMEVNITTPEYDEGEYYRSSCAISDSKYRKLTDLKMLCRDLAIGYIHCNGGYSFYPGELDYTFDNILYNN